jgi:hypothetical protein
VKQAEIKAVLAVYINADPQYPDNECISGLREDLPPSLLYSGKAVSGATILHRLLRNYLQLKGWSTRRAPRAPESRMDLS